MSYINQEEAGELSKQIIVDQPTPTPFVAGSVRVKIGLTVPDLRNFLGGRVSGANGFMRNIII